MNRFLTLFLIIICVISATSCSISSDKKPDIETVPPTETETAAPLKKTPVKGIDVSSFNGAVDWKKVKASGIKFAIIRAGGRGYGESGALYTDNTAEYNLTQAQKLGIKTGAYFFSQATSAEEAKEEAKFALKTLGNTKLSLPLAYDVERIKDDTSRIDNVKYSDSVKYAKVFMKTIKSAGYEPMVYIGEDSILKAEDFKGYKIWYADYKKPYEKGYEILQYSKTGRINGINGNVDLDIIYK